MSTNTMTPDQQTNLDATLDRVPLDVLRRAISRRTIDRRLHSISPAQVETYQTILDELSAEERVDVQTILSNCRLARLVSIRWKLYNRLDRAGLSVLQMATLTGHDSSRIYHWQKKSRPIVRALKKQAAKA